jgi:TrmH family RNA methyltransferase
VADQLEIITSVSNETVKRVRALQQREEREQQCSFLAEGVRVVEEGIRAGIAPTMLLCTLSALEQPRVDAIVRQVRQTGCPVRQTTDRVMSAVSDTVNPSGVLAVFPIRQSVVPSPLRWVLVADGLRDPGNLGTVLRSAWATQVQLVLTTANTVDVHSPKVVRSAMGAHFRLALQEGHSWPEIRHTLQGMYILLAKQRSGEAYWGVDWQRPTALVIGGEAEGASSEAERMADGFVHIPMDPTAESINAAVAASILLFEGARQRQ